MIDLRKHCYAILYKARPDMEAVYANEINLTIAEKNEVLRSMKALGWTILKVERMP
jgi:hypothetical protein